LSALLLLLFVIAVLLNELFVFL